MGSKTQALAQRQAGSALQKFMERSKADIMACIPRGLSAERLLSMLVYSLKTDSKLMECDLPSLAVGAITAAKLGMEINGILGHCYLIPRKHNGKLYAGFQLGYRGKIELLMRSGMFTGVDAEAVYEPDKFEYRKGLNPVLDHQPSISGDRKAKPPVAFWACAYPRGGGIPSFEVMSLDDIKAVRDSVPFHEKGPWSTHPDEMAKKTVLHRLMKRLPQASEAYKVAMVEDAPGGSISAAIVDEEEATLDDLKVEAPAITSKPHKGRASQKSAVPEDLDGFDNVDDETGEVLDEDLPDPGERVE